jgi:hypothetical protein
MEAPQDVGGSAPHTPWCDSSGGMRVLAVAAALTLAAATPAAGAPPLGSPGWPLFPADNVRQADVASGTREGGPIGIPGADVKAEAPPDPDPTPTRRR